MKSGSLFTINPSLRKRACKHWTSPLRPTSFRVTRPCEPYLCFASYWTSFASSIHILLKGVIPLITLERLQSFAPPQLLLSIKECAYDLAKKKRISDGRRRRSSSREFFTVWCWWSTLDPFKIFIFFLEFFPWAEGVHVGPLFDWSFYIDSLKTLRFILSPASYLT